MVDPASLLLAICQWNKKAMRNGLPCFSALNCNQWAQELVGLADYDSQYYGASHMRFEFG
jgi:hypothetical protein